MEDILNRFPIEIASYITQYTYNLQNKDLLNDIVNFSVSKLEIYKLYLDYFTQLNEAEEYINWISNDIVLYTNNFRHTGVLYGGGYTDRFYDRLFRNPFLKTKENVDDYIIKLTNSGTIKEINIYLGLLTIKEREDFILWIKSKNV
jgi:hypothetical protein